MKPGQYPFHRYGSDPRKLVLVAGLFFAGVLTLSHSVYAGLGLGFASIGQAQVRFGSTLTTTKHTGYSVYTHTLPSATLVREYLSDQDEVFAVAWEGPFWPDFKTLLGSHYEAYVDFIKQRRQGFAVQTTDLVIESGGKMGAFRGRVYLPSKLPNGMLPNVIQ